ncbi:MAG: HAD hydrolase-like protein [Candidatus Lokiarchaeota archaeon]|nr:HAD hydrolase-like protein [Candidatus Lokiarchaeota archaeon]
MIKGALFDFDGTLTTENSIIFMMRWHIRRHFESETHFNPFYGFFSLNRLFFYGFRYMRHLRDLFSKRNYDKPIEDIIIEYGRYVSKYYPSILRSFKGITKESMSRISRLIPLRSGVIDLLTQLKKQKIKIGICSMSLEIAALSSLNSIDLDYTACNNLIYRRGYSSEVTGDSMLNIRDAIDKKNIVFEFCKKFDLSPDEIAYIGDDFHDILAANIAKRGLIILDLEKINKRNIHFYKKAIKKYDFEITESISQIKRRILIEN